MGFASSLQKQLRSSAWTVKEEPAKEVVVKKQRY